MDWTMEVTPTEVRLLVPGVKLDEVLGPRAEDDEDESPYFSLEYQLRHFLADNLGVIPP
jgi:endonuclease